MDLVDELCALQLEGVENWEDALFSFGATTKVVGARKPPRARYGCGNGEQVAPLGTPVAFAAHFGRLSPGAG